VPTEFTVGSGEILGLPLLWSRGAVPELTSRRALHSPLEPKELVRKGRKIRLTHY
jgi:hypothetical protein